MDSDAYRELIDGKVRPLYDTLKRKIAAENLIQPRVVTGCFRCRSEGDTLFVEKEGREISFSFPRQAGSPHLCIADFFKTGKDGGDVVAFFVATIGERLGREAKRLFEGDEYRDYLLLHALGVEVTEALAEYWHGEIRNELGIGAKHPRRPGGRAAREYQGSRYGFGYSACPDLDAQMPVFKLLDPATIGVRLTEGMEMVPEMTISAIVAHHPQARYFAV